MTVAWHDRLPSTMDAAHVLAESGAAHGTAVAARRQDAGRGRRGRSWSSPEGGLWMSVVCRPAGPTGMEHLSLRVGLAVAGRLELLVPGLPHVTVKRPNDLLIEGRKVAGILCEARWEGPNPSWVVVGLGLNVTNSIPLELQSVATALGDHGAAVTPVSLAEPLAVAIARATLGEGPLTPAEEAALSAREPGP